MPTKNNNTRRFFIALGLAMAAGLTTTPAIADDNPYAAAPQSSLRKMLSIDYHLGPDLPVGIQDCGIGIVNGNLTYAGGLNPGSTFTNNAYGLNLASPQSGWQSLPNLPSDDLRQGLVSATVNNQVYMWGGFNYGGIGCSPPWLFTDGYRLSQTPRGQWAWSALPDLSFSRYCSGVAVIGSKIYLMGGQDLDISRGGMRLSERSRDGTVDRIGARLAMIDTNNLTAGWTELTPCPGTPRGATTTSAVNGKIYVIGGTTGGDNPIGASCNVVDNWMYDPTSKAWSRLQDSPMACSSFTPGQMVFNDRYVVMPGIDSCDQILRPDGTIAPNYGTMTKHDPAYAYHSDVLVYDTVRNEFGAADSLPLNNCLPASIISGNTLHMLGNECDGPGTGPDGSKGPIIDGKSYGHVPALYLTGTITVAPEPGAVLLLAIAGLSLLGYGWVRQK
jgi:N-acetylneuraminic acid mutarotase